MYKLTIKNHRNESLTLTQNPNYAVIDIDGLNPPKANINMGENANFDGATFSSSKLNTRNIVISILPLNNIEKNRISLYQFFKTKKEVTLFFSNGTRNVYIKGYVQTFECDLFQERERAQISIICPDPYFRTANEGGEIAFSTIVPMFEFEMDIDALGIPFSRIEGNPESNVVNKGDVETGMIIRLHAVGGTVENPSVVSIDTGKVMKLNVTMQSGDTIIINTNKGQKSIVLSRSGVTTNILGLLDITANTAWLTLESGMNTLTLDADSGIDDLECFVEFDYLYEGV